MATTVVKTIGNGTRDYTSIQAWEDAAPANLVTSDQVWEGQLYPEGAGTNGEWTISAYINISGSTSDATRFKRLRCAPGMSFSDNASAATNALRYNPANGVAIRQTSSYGAYTIDAAESFSEIIGVQLSNANSVQCLRAVANCTVKNAVIQSTGAGASIGCSGANSKVINSVLISTGTQVSVISSNAPISLTGCTIIRPSGTSALCVASYGGAALLKDCAVFGFTGSTGVSASSSYNATDLASLPGTSNQLSLAAATQFENTTYATLDLRAKAGNDLQFGIADALITTDIIGQTRAATPTIGAWEFSSGGGGATITANLGTATAAGFAASIIAAVTIACSLGGAVASGNQASISTGSNVTISATVGTATASGYLASVASAGSATITTDVFKNNTGTVLASTTIPKLAAIKLSDMTLAASWTNQSTDGSGVLSLTGAMTAATDYLLIVSSTDGASVGVKKYTAA